MPDPYAHLSCCDERTARKQAMEADLAERLALRELHLVARDCLRDPEAFDIPPLIRARLRTAVEAVDKLSD